MHADAALLWLWLDTLMNPRGLQESNQMDIGLDYCTIFLLQNHIRLSLLR